MNTIANLTSDDLKQIIKESVRETLSEKKLKEIFHEVIEDIAMAKAMDEGIRTETIDKNKFLEKLKSRAQ
ncbi:MAG TPA: hypothetical protein PKM65_09225 [Spirochaetota bacterium]|nr:hypothetical protein [Spirochaetota bacterium]HNT12788.1 hypothetical protein [Spirochaetota bacterium]